MSDAVPSGSTHDQTPSATPAAPPARALDPAGVRLLVTRLTVVLNRRRAYDAAHPMVRQSEEALLDAVRSVLGTNGAIALGVAHRELLVNGAPFAQGGAAAQELAARLHRRSVGALTLDGRLGIDGLRAAIAWLAIDPTSPVAGHAPPPDADRRGRDTLADQPPDVAGFQIARVPFDRLALQRHADERLHEANALWRSLAQAALHAAPDMDAAEAADAEPDADVAPDVLAEAIDRARVDAPRARRVGGLLHRLALELRDVPPETRTAAAQRLRDLLLRVDRAALTSILEALGDDETRHGFATTLADVLPASAVVDWLERIATMTEQPLSPHQLRLLAKLARVAGDDRATSRASGEFRETARRLLDTWTLGDALPVAHDALRLVQMACELDVVGEDTRLAAQHLVEQGQHGLLLDVLAAAPGLHAPAALGDVVLSPAALRRVLLGDPFDATEARRLLARARVEHAPLLLEVLAVAEQRSARRVLLVALRDLGPSLLPLLVRQLDPGAAWYYLRNVLVLLRDLLAEAGPDAPERLRAPLFLSFLDHATPQVRVEALRLALDLPTSRSIALLRALDDQNSRVVGVAIDALLAFAVDETLAASVASESEAFAQRLALLVDEHRFDAEFLARAVRATQIDDSAATRDWLLGHVTRRSRFLRRVRLAEGRPTVLAALRVLALRHAGRPAVDAVLAQAATLEPVDLRRKAVAQAGVDRDDGPRSRGALRTAGVAA